MLSHPPERSRALQTRGQQESLDALARWEERTRLASGKHVAALTGPSGIGKSEVLKAATWERLRICREGPIELARNHNRLVITTPFGRDVSAKLEAHGYQVSTVTQRGFTAAELVDTIKDSPPEVTARIAPMVEQTGFGSIGVAISIIKTFNRKNSHDQRTIQEFANEIIQKYLQQVALPFMIRDGEWHFPDSFAAFCPQDFHWGQQKAALVAATDGFTIPQFQDFTNGAPSFMHERTLERYQQLFTDYPKEPTFVISSAKHTQADDLQASIRRLIGSCCGDKHNPKFVLRVEPDGRIHFALAAHTIDVRSVIQVACAESVLQERQIDYTIHWPAPDAQTTLLDSHVCLQYIAEQPGMMQPSTMCEIEYRAPAPDFLERRDRGHNRGRCLHQHRRS